MINLLSLAVISALAVWEAIEIWHHSTIAAGLRARVEGFNNWFSDMLDCPFCTAPWASLLMSTVAVVCYVLLLSGHTLLGSLLLIPILALACARLANLFNDLSYKVCRTPKMNRLEDDTK